MTQLSRVHAVNDSGLVSEDLEHQHLSQTPRNFLQIHRHLNPEREQSSAPRFAESLFQIQGLLTAL
jgi:hypothetical protein